MNTKLIIWFIAAGLAAYGATNEGVRLYGKYALATASATATVFEMDEESVDSDTGQSGVKYTGIYRFRANGKTYYGRTDNYDVGEKLQVRYNPADPDFQNRDATDGLSKDSYSVFVFVAIICGLYGWLRWIRASEKTLPCESHPDRLTKKRFYHWAENKGFHYVVDHGPRCEECVKQLSVLHRLGSTELLYKPLPEPFSIPC